jgi:protein-tyrosine phosphatase
MGSYLSKLRRNVINFFAHLVQNLFAFLMNSLPAHEILPGLWLGNRTAAHDLNWQREKNINAIFNCTKDIPIKQGVAQRIYRIPLDDNLQVDEIRNLELWSWESAFKISKELEAGNRVLVHCAAGMQRSAAVVAIYIIAKYRVTTDEAIQYIKKRRPIAFYGNANFYNSIKGFEKTFRHMISEKNLYADFPRRPLPFE